LTLTERTQQIYAAFGRGDIPFILDQLDPDVHWEDWGEPNSAQRAGVPWLKNRHGRGGAREFFGIIGTMKFHQFSVLSIMEGPNQVAAEIELEVELPGGNRFREQEIHLLTFGADGQIVRFRHYGDWATHIEAAASMAG
jgi:ketosteroid isomerase-like protein